MGSILGPIFANCGTSHITPPDAIFASSIRSSPKTEILSTHDAAAATFRFAKLFSAAVSIRREARQTRVPSDLHRYEKTAQLEKKS